MNYELLAGWVRFFRVDWPLEVVKVLCGHRRFASLFALQFPCSRKTLPATVNFPRPPWFGEKRRDSSQPCSGSGSMSVVDATSFASLFSESHKDACSRWRRTEGGLHLNKYFWASEALFRSHSAPRDSLERHPNVFEVLEVCTALLRVEFDEISPDKPRHRHLERQSWTGRLVKSAKLDLGTQ